MFSRALNSTSSRGGAKAVCSALFILIVTAVVSKASLTFGEDNQDSKTTAYSIDEVEQYGSLYFMCKSEEKLSKSWDGEQSLLASMVVSSGNTKKYLSVLTLFSKDENPTSVKIPYACCAAKVSRG